MNPKVNFYFEKAEKWRPELELLRNIVLDCGLQEELKWGCPCYTLADEDNAEKTKKPNVVLIHVFKDYFAVLFFKGALLKDPEKILIQQTENVQAARQIRFTKLEEVTNTQEALKAYIDEAIEIEKAGLTVTLNKNIDLKLPEELEQMFKEDANLKAAFEALTPGRQRAYNLYFSGAKQVATRFARIEKYVPKILDGKGLNDE